MVRCFSRSWTAGNEQRIAGTADRDSGLRVTSYFCAADCWERATHRRNSRPRFRVTCYVLRVTSVPRIAGNEQRIAGTADRDSGLRVTCYELLLCRGLLVTSNASPEQPTAIPGYVLRVTSYFCAAGCWERATHRRNSRPRFRVTCYELLLCRGLLGTSNASPEQPTAIPGYVLRITSVPRVAGNKQRIAGTADRDSGLRVTHYGLLKRLSICMIFSTRLAWRSGPKGVSSQT
jgi:hypothetical protein